MCVTDTTPRVYQVLVGDHLYCVQFKPQPESYAALRARLSAYVASPSWDVRDDGIRAGRFLLSYQDDEGDYVSLSWSLSLYSAQHPPLLSESDFAAFDRAFVIILRAEQPARTRTINGWTVEMWSPLAPDRHAAGWGKATHQISGEVYEGHFMNDRFHGDGKFTMPRPDGSFDFFVGQFGGGKKNGPGVYKWATGETYAGEYVDGERHGYGVYTAGASSYAGYWSRGKRHGRATRSVRLPDKMEVVEGEWLQNALVLC